MPCGLQLYSYHARTENKALTYNLALSTEFSNVGSYSCTVVRASTAVQLDPTSTAVNHENGEVMKMVNSDYPDHAYCASEAQRSREV